MNAVHARMASLFPMLVCNGWQYKGYGVQGFGGVGFYQLRFEKPIRGKTGRIVLRVSQPQFSDVTFDLKGWIFSELHSHESELIERRRRELDCAA